MLYFWFTMTASAYHQSDTTLCLCSNKTNLHWYRFLIICFYYNFILALAKTAYVFSIIAYVFRNLFWKTCPLFRQILITCLKCSRASSSPVTYSEKMCWVRGWLLHIYAALKILFVGTFRHLSFLIKKSKRVNFFAGDLNRTILYFRKK